MANDYNLDFSKMDFRGDAFKNAFAKGFAQTPAGSANPMAGFTGTGLVGGPQSAGGTNAAANTSGSSKVSEGPAPIMGTVNAPAAVTMGTVAPQRTVTRGTVEKAADPTLGTATLKETTYDKPTYNAVNPNQPMSEQQQQAVKGAAANRDAYDAYTRQALGSSVEDTMSKAGAAAAQQAQGVSDQAVQQAIKAAKSSGAMGGKAALAATGTAAGAYGAAQDAARKEYFNTAQLGATLGAENAGRLQKAADDQTQRYGIDVGANTQRYGTDVGAAAQKYSSELSANQQKYGVDASTEMDRYKAILAGNQQRYDTDVGAATSRYGTDVGAEQSRYNTDAGLASSKYNTDVGAGTSRYNTEAGLAAQTYNTDVGSRDQRYGVNVGNAVSQEQLANERRGQDLGLVSQGIGAAGGVFGALAMSDRNQKTDIKQEKMTKGLDSLRSFSYKYKKGPAYEGGRKEAGVMAQDLEKTAMKPAVVQTPIGKMIDTKKLATMNTGALSEHENRLKAVEKALSYLGTMKKGAK